MKRRSFLEFVTNKEKDSEPLSTKISLGDGNDFKPFFVSDDPNSQYYGKNSGLAPIIRAFKKGANWGWSKDEKTGDDKPVKTGSKKLFLTGGALRDHLSGKTPRNIELATNASPDEIMKILKEAKLKFIGENDRNEPNTFFILSKNKTGRPFKFGIRSKDQLYELAGFTKKYDAENHEPGSQLDDAKSRDFTINAMYLNLTNDDGPNRELQDYFGGVHHLKSGNVKSIGPLSQRIQENPSSAFKFARMLNRYGEEPNPEDVDAIKNSDISIEPKAAVEEFFKGLDYDDCNCNKYLNLYNSLGLLKHIFPFENLDLDIPSDMSDKHCALAWMLKKNHPDMLQNGIGDRIAPEKLKKIIFLVKSLGLPGMDDNGLTNLKTQYLMSGMPEKKVKIWFDKNGTNLDLVNKLLR